MIYCTVDRMRVKGGERSVMVIKVKRQDESCELSSHRLWFPPLTHQAKTASFRTRTEYFFTDTNVVLIPYYLK